MRMIRPMYCLVGLAVILLYMAEAWAQEPCHCRGARQDRFTDGDTRLQWTFETYELVRSTLHPKFCYFKDVFNKSGSSIVKVKWQVADYYRSMIPSQKLSPGCSPHEGYMNTSTTRGKLVHGLGGDYNTEVRQPDGGWSKPEEKEKKGAAIQEKEPEILSAELQVYGDEKSLAHFFIRSSASRENDTKSILYYEIKNAGNMDISVLTNIPIVSSMALEVPMAQTPVPLAPGQTKLFKSLIEEQFEIRSVPLVIFDKSGDKILGAESVGVYAPIAGKSVRSDKDLWETVFK
jgi:hypothetical protein